VKSTSRRDSFVQGDRAEGPAMRSRSVGAGGIAWPNVARVNLRNCIDAGRRRTDR